jgi:hypothetical protein
VRTAVIIAAVAVTTKAALIAVALTAWASIPERRWPVNHWHVELGPLAEWLAAGAAAGAAIVALVIATLDRQHQIKDRRDDEKTQARLVQLSVETESGRPVVVVKARNFGPLPVLDIELVDATWSEHPGARWVTINTSWQARGLPENSTYRPILKPNQGLNDTFDTLVEFDVCFMHATRDETVVPVDTTRPPMRFPQYVRTDVRNVVVKVQFTTANGVRWETPTKGAGAGEPVRLR